MKKPIPRFETDAHAEDFVDTADLSEFDLAGGRFVTFVLRRKDKSVSLRPPEALLDQVRERAQKAGMPYQRFTRRAIEQALREPEGRGVPS